MNRTIFKTCHQLKEFSAKIGVAGMNRVIFRRFKSLWSAPDGYDTGINVYNPITRDKQPLIVKNKNFITWYTCGPTVYDDSHIGHASCYVKLDIIQKILKQYFNYNLVTAMNITDIDDKIIARSQASGLTVEQISKKYEKEFWEDLNALDVNRPQVIFRVTENMNKIVDFINNLVRNQLAYVSKDSSVYFDVVNCESYGKLGIGDKIEETSPEKRSSRDFALWKARKEGEVFWEAPWGSGRPGWHSECAALASYVYGSNIDIHAGGIDLKFPHHENEEAQACSYHASQQWVNYWLHTGHLHLKNQEKMSKSLKNTITISSLLKTVNSNVFRLACAMSHYRSHMEFSLEFMETAQSLLKNYKFFIKNCTDFVQGHIKGSINNEIVLKLLAESSCQIHEALIDDFNTPVVINVLNEVLSTMNSMLHSKSSSSSETLETLGISSVIAASNLVENTLSLFGIALNKVNISSEAGISLDEVLNILNDFRQDVRNLAKDEKNVNVLKLCDRVRNELSQSGVTIRDFDKTSSWSY